MTSPRGFLSILRKDQAAVAMTEFALAAPLMITIGIYGVETTNLAMTHMRISQVAIQIADNASRIGDTSTLQNRKIYENDINDLFYGADIHAGEATEIYEHGRVILSSLEEDDGRQIIRWQRCKGKNNVASSYGNEGDGNVGSPVLPGMGPPGKLVRAPTDGALMFVEVVYEYQPLISDKLISDRTISSVAAFIVRDDRDLSGIYQRDPGSPDPVADCASFDSFEGVAPVSASGGFGSTGGTSTSGSTGSTSSTTSGGSTTTTTSGSGTSTTTTTTSSSGSTSTTTTSTSSSGSTSTTTTTTSTSSGGPPSTSSGFTFPWP